MPVAARSDEHERRLRPFRGARPPRRGQWTAGARRPPIAFATAVKVPSDRMRGSQFSSWNISLSHRRYGCASSLCIALADPTPDKRDYRQLGIGASHMAIGALLRNWHNDCGSQAPDRRIRYRTVIWPEKPQSFVFFATSAERSTRRPFKNRRRRLRLPIVLHRNGSPDCWFACLALWSGAIADRI